MKSFEKDKLIADFIGVEILNQFDYAELIACPSHKMDELPAYYPTFYDWNRLMSVAGGLITHYYESHDLDDLMEAGGRFDIGEIYDEVVRAIEQINEKS